MVRLQNTGSGFVFADDMVETDFSLRCEAAFKKGYVASQTSTPIPGAADMFGENLSGDARELLFQAQDGWILGQMHVNSGALISEVPNG